MKHSIFIKKTGCLFLMAVCFPLAVLHAQTSETPASSEQSSSLLSSERLEENFGTDWTTIIQQEIAGMSTTLSYRRQGTPLIVVDGVTLPSHIRLGDLFFSSTQIEEVNFLQGPEAILQYGIRGNHGVLIISSKKGNTGQGLQTGLYSGMRFDNLTDDKASTQLNWQEGAYLNWGNEKHSIHTGYNSQLKYQNEFISNSPVAYTLPASKLLNNSLNTQLYSQWNETFSTQIGGNFQLRNGNGTTESIERFGAFNAGLRLQPAPWLSMKLTAAMNNHIDYSNNQEYVENFIQPDDFLAIYSDSLQSTVSEINFLISQNHPLNENLRLTAETGVSYYQISQHTNEMVTYPNDIMTFRDDFSTYTQYNGIALAGIEYKHWMHLKTGIQFQNMQNYLSSAPFTSVNSWLNKSISPYAAFTLQADEFIPENKILSSLSWKTSYGENIATQPKLPESTNRYKSMRNGFQTRLTAGLFNDRMMLESSYFSEANRNYSYENSSYRGFESLLSASIIQSEKLRWTTGITSLIMKDEYLLNYLAGYFAYTKDKLPGSPNPWNWQTSLINRLSWNGFNLHTQMTLFNSPQTLIDSEFKVPVQFYTSPEGAQDTYYSIYTPGTFEKVNLYAFRIQEITLSYSTPLGMRDNSFFKRINFAISGRNLFAMSNKKGKQTGDVFTDTKNQQYTVNLGLHF